MNVSVVFVVQGAPDRITLQSKLQGFTLKFILVDRRVGVAVYGFRVRIIMSQASHGVSQVVCDKRSCDGGGGMVVCEHLLSLFVVEESLEVGALSVRKHSVLHALLHGLGSLEHGEDWDWLASDGVCHEACEDGELVQHVEHEQVQEKLSCIKSSLCFHKSTIGKLIVYFAFGRWGDFVKIIQLLFLRLAYSIHYQNCSRRCE